MTRIRVHAAAVSLSVALSLATGLEAGDGAPAAAGGALRRREVPSSPAHPARVRKWQKLGLALGLQKPRWEPRHPVALVEPAPGETVEPPVEGREEETGSGRGEPVLQDPVALRVVNVERRIEYDVRVTRGDLDLVGVLVDRMGLSQGWLPPQDRSGRQIPPEPRHVGVASGSRSTESAAPGIQPHGWSDNDDSRVRLFATTTYPYRTIGTLFDGGGDCTGTLIGPRLVLTAAHCIYNRTTGAWNNINFKPGRDGADSQPYGSAGALLYWVPSEYQTAPGSGGAVNRWDIGLVVLESPVGNGWMGRAALSAGSLEDKTLFMRGYPRCNTTGAPAGCVPKTLWGDVQPCGLGDYFNPDDDGWNREIEANCDGSAGQSGSSFYYYYYNTGQGAWIPATIGVFSQHYCLAGCPGSPYDDFPNVITRITPDYLSVINFFLFWFS